MAKEQHRQNIQKQKPCVIAMCDKDKRKTCKQVYTFVKMERGVKSENSKRYEHL